MNINQTTTQQTATITYAAPRPVNIGDVFCRVEQGKRNTSARLVVYAATNAN